MPTPPTSLDTTLILTGFAGELFFNGIMVAQCNTWHASVAVANVDYQPAGVLVKAAIMTGVSQTLAMTETVMDDTLLLQPVLLALAAQTQKIFQFAGKLIRNDGSIGYYSFANCVADGSVDIASVAPGEVLNRAWTFRINGTVKATSLLGGAQTGL